MFDPHNRPRGYTATVATLFLPRVHAHACNVCVRTHETPCFKCSQCSSVARPHRMRGRSGYTLGYTLRRLQKCSQRGTR